MSNKESLIGLRMMSSRLARWLVGITIVGLGVVGIVSSTGLPGQARATIGPAPQVALSGPDAAFFEYMAPRLDALLADARRLSVLGEERSRNVIAIRSGQQNVNDLLEDLDGHGTREPIPTRFRPFWNSYVEAGAALRDGMDGAGAAFRQFDWKMMERSLVRFDAGIQTLAEAKTVLYEAAGLAPSSASRGNSETVGGLPGR